jgi:hypothetical protein
MSAELPTDSKLPAFSDSSSSNEQRNSSAFSRWLLEEHCHDYSGEQRRHPTHPWWQVMCLTGVDYFSTLGYQPGIAPLAAGVLSPVATLVLVLVTLLVALPIYRQVAARSPHGQGSIVMLEQLLPRWKGKTFVLCLLGFALTDFVITITLSAADATAHIIENPLVPETFDHPVLITLSLLAFLGAVFLRGFKEAVWLAVLFVSTYLVLNGIVLVVGVREIIRHPGVFLQWHDTLLSGHGSPWTMIGVAILLFPRLALGLSGFETGAAVMPLVQGEPGDTEADPAGRIRNTQTLLLTAALIMTVFLIGSSLITTLLIPAKAFERGGEANGRALAYLAHHYLGETFGTLYDLSSICILWFAGASAMAGLLNLVPRYLPPYGMAPEWAKARRPLVFVFMIITFVVTILFEANVDAQGGAYATGVLFLMSSAAVAVTIANWRTLTAGFTFDDFIFIYTTITNMVERPEGIKIASFFIGAIVFTSFLSRVIRITELRIHAVEFLESAQKIIQEVSQGEIRIIAHRPDKRSPEEYDRKESQAREDHSLDSGEPIVFLEVVQGDA